MDILSEYWDQLISAFWMTIKLTALSAVGALVLGTILAAMRVSPSRWPGGSAPPT
ncbi:glutamate ABC transporter permease domain protein [Rhodococcus sp. MTM3W5.2]|nr:glutamate ABC transporter permease domain protein [Rhodococcus sp. MTM3W5.2]